MSARALGLGLGVLADAAFADPRRGHPVALFGTFAAAVERRCWRDESWTGAAYTATVLAVPISVGVMGGRAARGRPLVEIAMTAGATWAVLGGTSLGREAATMATFLRAGDLPAARARLSHLCARDATDLDAPALARATVESVAENTSDAVVGPLLWGAVAGIPGLLGYRAVNTLDAMVGYRSERYRRFGRAAARLDDAVNLAPARLTGVLTVLLASCGGGRGRVAAGTLWADRRAHPSPNAGWCEAAAAGALGVRLGGSNAYGGRDEHRPVLGRDGRAVEIADIDRAIRLSRAVGVAATACCVAVAAWVSR